MTLKEILHELAGRVNAGHLHEEIDALPDDPELGEVSTVQTSPAKGKAKLWAP